MVRVLAEWRHHGSLIGRKKSNYQLEDHWNLEHTFFLVIHKRRGSSSRDRNYVPHHVMLTSFHPKPQINQSQPFPNRKKNAIIIEKELPHATENIELITALSNSKKQWLMRITNYLITNSSASRRESPTCMKCFPLDLLKTPSRNLVELSQLRHSSQLVDKPTIKTS